MPASQKPFRAVEVFCSYSHKDQRYREQFEAHVALMKRQKVIQVWQDRKILAGGDWAGEIDSHLNTANIVALFISADFLSSNYCYDKEMKRALERHKKDKVPVVPILVRPCDWKDAPFAHFQAIPNDNRPVTTWKNRDAAWTEVANYLKLTVKAVLERIQRNLRKKIARSAKRHVAISAKDSAKRARAAELKRTTSRKRAAKSPSAWIFGGKQPTTVSVKTRDGLTPDLRQLISLQERIDAIDRDVNQRADQKQLDLYAHWYKYIKGM